MSKPRADNACLLGRTSVLLALAPPAPAEIARGLGAPGGNNYVPGAISRAQSLARPATLSIAELHDEDVQIRRQVAWTLMTRETDAISELLQATKDEDKAVRWFALEALRANIFVCSFATPDRRRNLLIVSTRPQTNIDACPERSRKDEYIDDEALVSMAEKLITDEDEYVRQAALDLLSEIGERGIARLLQFVAEGKIEALWTLRDWLGAQGEAGIETLMQFVHGSEIKLRDAALIVMGKTARLAAPTLIELLADADENIRVDALNALLEMGEGAVPFLQKATHDFVLAQDALEGRQKPSCMLAQHALDGLKKLRTNKDLRTALPSLNIARLIAMGDELALPMISQQLKAPDKKTRIFSAKALSYIGQAAVPVLIDALNSSDTNIRRRACEALRDISSPLLKGAGGCPEAREALEKALTDTDVKVRQNAVRALARIGNPDDLETIRLLLSDASRAVRKTVREALKRET